MTITITFFKTVTVTFLNVDVYDNYSYFLNVYDNVDDNFLKGKL